MMLKSILPILLCSAIFVSEAQKADSRAFENIQAAIQSKQYDQALASVNAFLENAPNDERLLTLQGMALAGLGKQEDALHAYNSALRNSPNFLPALEAAAELEYSRGSSRALPLLRRILKIRPADPTANAMLGTLAYRNQDCSVAVIHFAKSAQFIRDWQGALEQYAECLVALDRLQEAIPIFADILQKSPDDVHARYRLAVVQMATHHTDNALETLQPLLVSEKQESYVLDLAALAYEDKLDTPRAVQLLRNAIIADPTVVKYYLDFATLAFTHGSFETGIEMMTVGIQHIPDAGALFMARGVLRMQVADYSESEDDFRRAYTLDPSLSSSGIAIGMAAAQRGDLDKALKTTEAQLKKHPEDAFLQYMKASILTQQGAIPGSRNFEAALEAALEATKRNPKFVLARDSLADLYMQSGAFDQAIIQSRLALKTDPSDQTAVYHLLQSLRHKGAGTHQEVADLAKRLVSLRREAYQRDALVNRYKLVLQKEPEKQSNEDPHP